MSNTIKKYKIQQVLNENNDTLELHPETDADIVNISKTINGVTVTNVNDAINQILLLPNVSFVSINSEDYNNDGTDVAIPNSIGEKINNSTVICLYEHAGSHYDNFYYCVHEYADDEGNENILTFANESGQFFDIVHDILNDTYSMGELTKYNYANIINDLITNDGYAPLSAAMGKKLQDEKQPLLTFDNAPTANSNNPVKSSGIFTAMQNILAVAEGRTKNIVIATTGVSSSYANGELNTTTNATPGAVNINLYSYTFFKDVSNNDIPLNSLKVGDIISITNTNVPDRWVGAVSSTDITFYPLETKFYVETTLTSSAGNSPVSGAAVWAELEARKLVIDAQFAAMHGLKVIDIGTANLDNYSITSDQLSSIDFATVIKHYTRYYFYQGIYQQNQDTSFYIFACLEKITNSNIYYLKVNTSTGQTTAHSQFIGTGNYTKPSSGIPSTDLASAVQTSLGKADTAYQKPSGGIPSSDLANSGVSAGTYSAVTVNAKGQVTAGAQMIEVGTTNQATPSASLAVGGLFFKEI